MHIRVARDSHSEILVELGLQQPVVVLGQVQLLLGIGQLRLQHPYLQLLLANLQLQLLELAARRGRVCIVTFALPPPWPSYGELPLPESPPPLDLP